MEKKKNERWLHPYADFPIVRTDQVEEMVGKFFAEDVRRRWTDDVLDDATGEVVSVERSELEFCAGACIEQTDVPRLRFLLQAGEILDVGVRTQNIPCRAYSFKRRSLWEVTMDVLREKSKFLVLARWMEEAITIASDFASAYQLIGNGYDVEKCQCVKFVLLDDEGGGDEDGEDDEEDEEEHDFDWYRVTVLTKWTDSFDGKEKKERRDYVLRAHDVGEAKKNVLLFKMREDHKWLDDPGRSYMEDIRHTVIKAKPYEVTAVVPAEYSYYYDKGPWTGC